MYIYFIKEPSISTLLGFWGFGVLKALGLPHGSGALAAATDVVAQATAGATAGAPASAAAAAAR